MFIEEVYFLFIAKLEKNMKLHTLHSKLMLVAYVQSSLRGCYCESSELKSTMIHAV